MRCLTIFKWFGKIFSINTVKQITLIFGFTSFTQMGSNRCNTCPKCFCRLPKLSVRLQSLSVALSTFFSPVLSLNSSKSPSWTHPWNSPACDSIESTLPLKSFLDAAQSISFPRYQFSSSIFSSLEVLAISSLKLPLMQLATMGFLSCTSRSIPSKDHQ